VHADEWKKNSSCPPAAMNPNPLSRTSRLIVPVITAIDCVLRLSRCAKQPVTWRLGALIISPAPVLGRDVLAGPALRYGPVFGDHQPGLLRGELKHVANLVARQIYAIDDRREFPHQAHLH
jgi:hypothetical protein